MLKRAFYKTTEEKEMSKDDTHPGAGQTDHDETHGECDEHHHDCYISLRGKIRCENHCRPPLEYRNRMITVGCGSDDPSPQIAAYQALPANLHAELVTILDLGHDGWVIWFRIPTIYI